MSHWIDKNGEDIRTAPINIKEVRDLEVRWAEVGSSLVMEWPPEDAEEEISDIDTKIMTGVWIAVALGFVFWIFN